MTFYLAITLKSIFVWLAIIILTLCVAFIAGFCIGAKEDKEEPNE